MPELWKEVHIDGQDDPCHLDDTVYFNTGNTAKQQILLARFKCSVIAPLRTQWTIALSVPGIIKDYLPKHESGQFVW